MADFDVIVVGAGHNGLISACYLAKAGYRVQVVERRPMVGGAVCTEEIIPGYRFDVGSSAHIMFKSTPIMDELRLADFGLEYIEMDPWAYYPAQHGKPAITFFRDVEKTCASIHAVSPEDAVAYRKFITHWAEINEGVWEVFLKTPTPGNLFGTIFKRNLFRPRSRKLWNSLDTTRQLMTSYGRVIEENFRSENLRAALTWLAAQSGPDPTATATGDFVGWQAMIHKHGAWRARGGSGSLTQALAKCLVAHGGEILLDAPVEKISRTSGRLSVSSSHGTHSARAVLGACHVQTTFLKLLDPELLPPDLEHRVKNIRVGNGFGMVVRHAVSELPQYAGEGGGVQPCHSAMQLLCPTQRYLELAHRDFLRGEPPRDPAVLAMTFSAIDPTLAPPGKHVLFGWAQYHPYELDNGENWDDIAEREADKIYEVICRHAPNMRGALIDRFIQTPLDIERRLGLLRANVMHVEMSFDQMFAFRPLPELAGYKTPIAGLYLTGASTHPGGGVFGASGRNAAAVVERDLRKKKI